jgi:N-acetylmuramoyl-L-alanine amidase
MKIFIDAGHNNSGWDTGAQGLGLREQDITWSIANLVEQKLTRMGAQIKLSRTKTTDNIGTDLNSSLAIRSKMSNDFGADYFISIHCNAGGGTGTETYAFSENGKGTGLARAVQKRIIAELGLRDRGVKFANFHVLRATIAPAILIETAFIDHASDNLMLRNHQDRFAQAIAGGIADFTGLKNLGRGEQEMITDVCVAIRKLQEKGVISTPEYWESAKNIVNFLPELLINMANKL